MNIRFSINLVCGFNALYIGQATMIELYYQHKYFKEDQR
jgi:hypothetical protein